MTRHRAQKKKKMETITVVKCNLERDKQLPKAEIHGRKINTTKPTANDTCTDLRRYVRIKW